MTTPAHCTRTGPHEPHEFWLSDLHHAPTTCPGVEPPADVAADRSERERLRARRRAEIGTQAAVLFGPADVQATPDPRLDEHIRLTPATLAQMFHETYERLAPDYGYRTREASAKPWDEVPEGNRLLMIATAAEILDVLDDLAAAQTMHEPDEEIPGLAEWERALILERQRTPAPAGLSAAQEIRLRLAERYGYPPPMAALQQSAAWVEHGDDETPDLRKWAEPHDYAAGFATGRLVSQVEIAALVARADLAEARLAELDKTPDPERRRALVGALREANAKAKLAEARLGRIDDALRDFAGHSPAAFINAVQECLAWTPDDTATAGAATGDGDGDA